MDIIELDVEKKIISDYKEKYPLSEKYHQEFLKYMPGGNTKSLSYFLPWPLHITHGKGAYVYTHEGHKLLDVTNSYGALIHGHADPDVTDVVKAGVERGTQFAAPTDAQYELSRMLCKRVASIDKIRYCNSGTEATLFALRTARAYTRRNKILKMSGGYHGTHDCVAASAQKNAVILGIPPGMTEDMIEVPFNNFELLEKAIAMNKTEIAAVIMEPFMGAGGIITPIDGYLQFIRELTEKNNILLIFDEIFSFRIDEGGAQAFYNVEPDLTALGKIVGGGFPIGAFGGKNEIMDIYCPLKTEKPLYHSGTFNGYQTAMQAGFAALKKYGAKKVEKLNTQGHMLFEMISESIKKHGLNIQVNREGSVLNLHFVNETVSDYETALKSEEKLLSLLHLSLLNKGIYATPRGLYILSTPMTDENIRFLAQAVDVSLSELLPLIKEKFFHLLLL